MTTPIASALNPDDPFCEIGQGFANRQVFLKHHAEVYMHPIQQRLRSVLGLMIALASFSAAAQVTTATPPAGRLLAANCFQCHGYNGKSSIGFERLAGESVSEIYNELREMRSKVPPKMMDMHARGYSDAQIKLIAEYLSKQR